MRCGWSTLLVVFCLFLPLSAHAAVSGESIAQVVALRGQVQAVDSAGASRVLSLKAELFLHETVITAERARLQIMFPDNTLISLGSKSEMRLTDYQWQAENGTGRLQTEVKEGVFRVMGGAITKGSPENFSTRTPVAVIGVRGSMYSGVTDATSLAVVFQGGRGIEVRNDAGAVLISRPGFGTSVALGRAPLPALRIHRDVLANLQDALGAEDGVGAPGNGKPDQQGNDAGQPHRNDGEGGRDEHPPGTHSEETPASGDESGKPGTGEGQHQDGQNMQNRPPSGGDGKGPAGPPREDSVSPPTGQGQPGGQNPQGGAPGLAAETKPQGSVPAAPTNPAPVVRQPAAGFAAPLQPLPPPPLPPVMGFAVQPMQAVFQRPVNEIPTTSGSQSGSTTTSATQPVFVVPSSQPMSGAFLTGRDATVVPNQAPDPATDEWTFGRYTATSTDGQISGTVTGHRYAAGLDRAAAFSFDFVQRLQTYNPVAAPYDGPRKLRVAMNIDGVPVERDYVYSSSGEFSYLLTKDTVDGSPAYHELVYAGVPTLAVHLPTTGISRYKGELLAVQYGLGAARIPLAMNGSMYHVFVNWQTGRYVGAFLSSETSPAMPGDGIFMFGDVLGNTLANGKLIGLANGYEDLQSGNAPPYDGVTSIINRSSNFATFYGSATQGLGGILDGDDFSLYNGVVASHWQSINAGFLDSAYVAPVVPAAAASTWHGFVVGMAGNLETNALVPRRLFFNSNPNQVMLSIDRGNGTLTGSISAADRFGATPAAWLDHVHIGGGPMVSAYITDSVLAALLSDDPVTPNNTVQAGFPAPVGGGLRQGGDFANAHFLVSAAPAGSAPSGVSEQFASYATWGYWEIAYTDPASNQQYHLPNGFWLAGDNQSATTYLASVIGSNQTGRYQGKAEGLRIDTANLTTSRLPTGTADIMVTFSAVPTINGSLDFPGLNDPDTRAPLFAPRRIDFAGNGISTAGGINSFSVGVTNPDLQGGVVSQVNGAFFGPQAQSIGGNFDATFTDQSRYIGVFGGDRGPLAP